jgi:hypothetical protein
MLGDVSIADFGYLNTFAHVAFDTSRTSRNVPLEAAKCTGADMD